MNLPIDLIEKASSVEAKFETQGRFGGPLVQVRAVDAPWDSTDYVELTLHTKGGYLFTSLSVGQARELADAIVNAAERAEARNG